MPLLVYYMTSASYRICQKKQKWHFINLHWKLDSDLHKTDLYEKFFFRNILSQESSALDVLKYIFKKSISIYPNAITAFKMLLTASVAVAQQKAPTQNEKFSKITCNLAFAKSICHHSQVYQLKVKLLKVKMLTM